MARRRWQEGTIYLRKSNRLLGAWWGRYVQDVIQGDGTAIRFQRNVFLGYVKDFTKPMAKRALRDFVDKANNYRPEVSKSQAIGKAATPFSVFADRWQSEVLKPLPHPQ